MILSFSWFFFVILFCLPPFMPFLDLVVFPLLLDYFFEIFWLFSLLAVLHGALDSNFKLYTFCC
jgi:hypothetical protein